MIYVVCSDTDIIAKFPDLATAQSKAQQFALGHPGVNVYVHPPCFEYTATAPLPPVVKLDPTTSLVIP